MKILAFAGALRANSVSKQLVREASRFLGERGGVAVDYVDLKQFPFPVYDTDIEETDGIPGTVLELGRRIAHADALVIAAPEYNGAISSVLKALIDWLSRIQPCPLSGKFLLLVGASPSGSGGVVGLWHTRVPFEALGVHVFPHMVAVPRSHGAFDTAGTLVDGKTREKLHSVLSAFAAHAGKHQPAHLDAS
jgi:NAD(P)H-dependent FMN reductase